MTNFRLLDLPAELRYHVYSFLIPNDMVITFENCGWLRSGEPDWTTNGIRKGEDVPSRIGGNPFYKNTLVRRWNHITVETQLFRVSKFVSNEALCKLSPYLHSLLLTVSAVLYGLNTYNFTVHGQTMWPKSLRSPLVFGPLGHPDRLPLLRNLRRIHIEVVPDINSHWAVKRQRSRLEYLVEILKEYADDSDQKSLLEDLKVDFQLTSQKPAQSACGKTVRGTINSCVPKDTEKFMFGLESLAYLRGIKDVEITGLPEWYTKCLQLSIQGRGGGVEKIDWPLVGSRRRGKGNSTQWKKYLVSTRKWHQPTLNWKEFAERNKITTPVDIEDFYAAGG